MTGHLINNQIHRNSHQSRRIQKTRRLQDRKTELFNIFCFFFSLLLILCCWLLPCLSDGGCEVSRGGWETVRRPHLSVLSLPPVANMQRGKYLNIFTIEIILLLLSSGLLTAFRTDSCSHEELQLALTEFEACTEETLSVNICSTFAQLDICFPRSLTTGIISVVKIFK